MLKFLGYYVVPEVLSRANEMDFESTNLNVTWIK